MAPVKVAEFHDYMFSHIISLWSFFVIFLLSLDSVVLFPNIKFKIDSLEVKVTDLFHQILLLFGHYFN